MTVGEKIREIRKLKGISQKALATLCNMSEPAIRNYELGNRTPSPKQLEKIAKALKIEVDDLMDDKLLKVEEQDFIENYRKLDDKCKEIFRYVAKAMIEALAK